MASNAWITHVKEWAAKHKMSYRDALRDPKMKAAYQKKGSAKPAEKKAPKKK